MFNGIRLLGFFLYGVPVLMLQIAARKAVCGTLVLTLSQRQLWTIAEDLRFLLAFLACSFMKTRQRMFATHTWRPAIICMTFHVTIYLTAVLLRCEMIYTLIVFSAKKRTARKKEHRTQRSVTYCDIYFVGIHAPYSGALSGSALDRKIQETVVVVLSNSSALLKWCWWHEQANYFVTTIRQACCV